MNRHLVPRQGKLLATQLDYVLLDASGSMADKWPATLAAIQAFCSVFEAENIHSHGILHLFRAGDIESLQRDLLVRDWQEINSSTVSHPIGGTPLYDAINLMVRRIADLDPPRCSIVIVTDGFETSSTVTTEDQARNLLDWCRAKGYQVTFLGADFNNNAQAKALGASPQNSIGVQKTLLRDAGKLLGKKRSNWARGAADMDFTSDEKTTFGGYLGGPGAK